MRLCPRHQYLGAACLADHRLAFTRRSVKTGTGVADILPAQGQTVWGALYAIHDNELIRLDRKEGYDWAYTRIRQPVRLEADHQQYGAIIYTVRHKEESEVPPSRRYLESVIAAAYERGLPSSYIEKLEVVIPAESRA